MAAVEEPAEPAGPAPGSAHLPEISVDKRVGLALALAIVAVGALAIWIATGFRIGNYPDPLTSRGLPYILGGFMILGGGVLVSGVVPGGPAAKAGVKKGDVILELDGQPTATGDVLVTDLANLKPGERVPVTVSRSGKKITFTVTLGDLGSS